MKLLYQFSAGDSFLHRLDPRTKLVFVVCFLISTFLLPHPWIMPLVIIAVIWIFGRVSPLEYLVFILFLLPLMTAIVLIHLLTDGPPYFDTRLLGVVPISSPGWDAGLLVAFRLAAMGIAFIMFSITTDPFDWGMAMYQSGLNYKVAFMFAFAMRFFPLLQEELVVIRNALTARGYRAIGSRNPYVFLRGVAISIMPLGLGALRRSRDIALAMELRGFNYAETVGARRTVFRDIRMRPRDHAVVAVSGLGLVAAVGLSVRLGAFPEIPRAWLVFLSILLVLFSAIAWRISRTIKG
ncbi:MAG TPA: energy-coupling factor transporter transmembrane component T [Solirubrobacterales bacterium]|nr:energy-coupling factor transporter transmembrane component T [Solirubrobacterales bacterium]